MTPAEDVVRLKHMLDYAREAIDFARGKIWADLDADRLYNLAMTRPVELVGESAAHVSIDTQQEFSQVLWPQIIAARNRLIHGYDQINFDILWDIVDLDLPPLVAQLELVLTCLDSKVD